VRFFPALAEHGCEFVPARRLRTGTWGAQFQMWN
jgi:hypothetical protein